MLLCSTNNLQNFSQGAQWVIKPLTGSTVGPQNQGVKIPQDTESSTLRIKEMLKKVELSVSSYDTAWVAMGPSLDVSNQPCFPQCLNWVIENQRPDGSWSLDPTHPLLIKDSLSSTLASVLALQTWNVGHQLIHKGLDFIGSNIWAAMDIHQNSPIGFDIIFPSMIQNANNLGLNLSLDPFLEEAMHRKRHLEIMSLKDKTRNLAYVAEGLIGIESNAWKEVMKYQRSNGSILNSPSSTAAALIHLHNEKCFHYLHLLVKKFNNAVPTIYPSNIYARLFLIDELEKLGIDRHVKKEKETVLDDIYRLWTQGNEEIFFDPKCCAMAFRHLRMNRYDVSSDALTNFEEEEKSLYAKDTKSALELFKASQLTIFQDEPILDRIYTWTATFLKVELVNGAISDKALQNEVDYALKHPHASLKRIENRNYIENYNTEKIRLHKTSYRFLKVDERILLAFSSQDFNKCQSIIKKELAYLERWENKYGLDKQRYARRKVVYCFFSIASKLFEPEFCNARLSWTQNAALITVVDDFFDHGGSMEELLNLISLVERWDEHESIGFMTKEVEILFYAIYDALNELADKARKYQGRCVKRHLIDIWICILKAMLKEAEYVRYKVPTIEEYTESGCITIGLGPTVLIALYFVEKMSEEVVSSEEYQNLFMHMSLIGRLCNDYVTAQKDIAEGKLNSVSLRVLHSNGAITEEEAKEEVARTIETHRRELLRIVLQTEGSIVPKACKDLFWMTSKDLHLFYMSEDGFSSPSKMVSGVNAVINDPIVVP